MGLFIWDNTLNVDVTAWVETWGLSSRFPATGAVLDISDIIQYFAHDKSSSI